MTWLTLHVPTMIEEGTVGFLAGSYVGLLAPAGIPGEAMAALGAAMAAIVREDDFRQRMAGMGGEVASNGLATPAGFAALIAEDLERSRNAAQKAGIRPE